MIENLREKSQSLCGKIDCFGQGSQGEIQQYSRGKEIDCDQ